MYIYKAVFVQVGEKQVVFSKRRQMLRIRGGDGRLVGQGTAETEPRLHVMKKWEIMRSVGWDRLS